MFNRNNYFAKKERYMTSLMPLLKDISAFRAPPSPAQFNEETFLSKVDRFQMLWF